MAGPRRYRSGFCNELFVLSGAIENAESSEACSDLITRSLPRAVLYPHLAFCGAIAFACAHGGVGAGEFHFHGAPLSVALAVARSINKSVLMT